MTHDSAAVRQPVAVGVIGAGRIGSSHAELLARHIAGARLVGVADARPAAADALARRLGCRSGPDPAALIADPDVEAVVIAATTEAHADLVEQVADAGKAVFCEKPAGLTLAEIDRGIAATDAAGVAFQVGFNRRFARDFSAGHEVVSAGGIGTPQLMRSLTRDPRRPGGGLADPGGVPPWTIFRLTLIHDFDTLLWLNPGAEPATVHATADALIEPAFKDAGLLDTAVVVVTFDNGAIAVAEASFSAAYGYDVRGEVFGSAGMVTLGEGARSSLRHHTESGRHADTARGDVELLRDSYIAELDEFVSAVRDGRPPSVTGRDARRALLLALASIRSVETGSTVRVADVVEGVSGVSDVSGRRR